MTGKLRPPDPDEPTGAALFWGFVCLVIFLVVLIICAVIYYVVKGSLVWEQVNMIACAL